MTPEFVFEGGIDPDLERLGKATMAFLREVSEGCDADVGVVLQLLIMARDRDRHTLTPDDLATMTGAIGTLQLRLNHGHCGEPVLSPLQHMDVSGMRGN